MKQKLKEINDNLLMSIFMKSVGIRVTDREGTIVLVNDFYCSLLGFAEHELVGTHYLSLLPDEFKEQQILERERLLMRGESFSVAVKEIKKDGRYIDLNLFSTLAEDEDETYIISTFQDISDTVRLNEIMIRMGDHAKIGGWERDLKTDTIIWTEGVFQIYELPVGEIPKFDDEKLLDFFAQSDLDRLIESHDYTIRTGKKSEIVTAFTAASGTKKWIKNTTDTLYVNGELVKLFGTFQDITDQVEKEQLIKEKQLFYKYLFDNNPTPVLLIEDEAPYNVVNVNEAAINLYGYSNDEFVGLSSLLLRAHSSEHRNQAITSETFGDSSATIQTLLTKHVTKQGEQIDVQLHWNHLVLNGKKLRLILSQNITEQLQNSIKLEQANALFSTLISSAPIAIVTIDKQACVELWNAKAEEIFGWKFSEIKGKLLPYIPEDKAEETYELLNKSLTSSEPFILELKRKRKSGAPIYIREYVTPLINSEGEVEKILLLIEDITESNQVQMALIESEQKYRHLVETSSDMIWKLDLSGEIIFVNKACRSLLGYGRSDLLYSIFNDHVAAVDRADFEQLRTQVITGETIDNLPLKMQCKNGDIIYLIATLYPSRNAEGVITGCTGSASDVTHMITYQNKLEASLKEKEILIKEIHHRVKNNLAIVSGLFTLQAMTLEDEKTIEVFNESQSRIQSIATIHERLYQNELFTRIEINDYLKQLTQDIKNTYARIGADITMIVEGEPVNLNVNQAVPFGILANEMLINAYKYAFPDNQQGKIWLRTERNEDGLLTFTVKDNGVGLPDNFEELSASSLGMSLIKNLSDQLNATLTIESNEGASFTIQFLPDS